MSRESNFWWLPTQLTDIEAGTSVLHPAEIVDLVELYRAPGRWPAPAEWQLMADTSVRASTSAAVKTTQQLGLERLADEVFGRVNGVDVTALVIRLLAVIKAVDSPIEFPALGLQTTHPVVQLISDTCDVPASAVVSARHEVAIRKMGAVASLSQDLQLKMVVPAIGLRIAQGRFATLCLVPKKQRLPHAPIDLLDRAANVQSQFLSPDVPSAAPLGLFVTGVLSLDSSVSSSQLHI